MVASVCVNLTNDIKCTAHELNAITALEKTAHASPHKEDAWDHLHADMEFFDDVTGKTLSHALTAEARKLEMKFFRKMGVYTKVPRSEARANGCRVITARWLNINKGDDSNTISAAALWDAS